MKWCAAESIKRDGTVKVPVLVGSYFGGIMLWSKMVGTMPASVW